MLITLLIIARAYGQWAAPAGQTLESMSSCAGPSPAQKFAPVDGRAHQERLEKAS
jgi:hypothetical protein